MAANHPRPNYLNKLISYKDKDVIKIVTGIRRCGKSTLLDLFEEYLSDTGIPKSQIIHMNLESLKYRSLTNYLSFYEYISERIRSEEKHYLIFDELQMVTGWEKAIESFRLDFNVDIYITGSNSYLFSNEFSTLLSGRYVEIRMLPLSFQEFLTFYEFSPTASIEEKFQKYVKYGGMPVLSQFESHPELIHETLEGIYNTVIIRDILERSHVSDPLLLNKIVHFLADNIGNVTSPRSIGNILSNEKELTATKNNVAGKTVDRYIDMLQHAYMFYSVGRYDIKGKQFLKTLEKNYIVDIGFRNMLLGYRDVDRGHILENVVFLELLRRDYRISIGKIGDIEVDFIAEKPNEKLYIQVTETMAGEDTRVRELKPLKAISDNYPKFVLSMDRSFVESYEGIQLIYLPDFLLGQM